ILLGKCFRNKKIFDLALKQFEQVLGNIKEMNEDKKDVLYTIGTIYEYLGDKEKALSFYKQIYEVDINYQDIKNKLKTSE
ncbi:tetratricopeptide repeat protein, partial [bacterium]|nr:tetratricopeptide repeat protein [bacterium]